MIKNIDLFTLIVEKEKLHHNFLAIQADHAIGIRNVLESWVKDFADRDGKFVKEFQTTFNSCFWELYLFAVLKELSIDVDFSFSAPDFVSSSQNIILEATCANHAHDDVPEWEKTLKGIIKERRDFEINRNSSIRFSNAFMSKLKKYRENYSNLDHVKGKPFIIAISNFSGENFNLQGDVGMQWLLYDTGQQKTVQKKNGSEINMGLFLSNSFSDVSAVIYSALATTSKARILNKDVGDITCHAIRIKNNETIIQIEENICDYHESLTDGLRLIVNPFAKNPVDIRYFENSDIRIFMRDINGDLIASCHEAGDLCMRFVESRYPKDMIR